MDDCFDIARSPLSLVTKGLENMGDRYGAKKVKVVMAIERAMRRLEPGPLGASLAFDPDGLQFVLIRPDPRAPAYVPFPWSENQIDHTAHVDAMSDAMVEIIIEYSAVLAELRLIESFSCTLHESLQRVTDALETIDHDQDRMWNEVEIERAQMLELNAEFEAEMKRSKKR